MFFTTGAQLQAAINALPATKVGGFTAFDAFFYGQQYMSAGKYTGTLSPIEHFVQIGAAQGNKPSAAFDPVYYASKYADLANKGFDAADLLIHFLRTGLDEGRTPNATLASFDGAAYLTAYPDVATYVNANLASFGGSTSNGAIAHYVKFGQYQGFTIPGTVVNTFSLTANQDTLAGTSGNDTFNARIFDNQNTLQSGDVINGGAGTADRLNADVGNSQKFAISPETTGVEIISIRAQAVGVDSNNNNSVDLSTSGQTAFSNAGTGAQVQIDAQRMAGVTQWESSNSRADVVIEDVRIAADLITKDVTIAFVESDPGNVDLGVYFDQHSLRTTPNLAQGTVSFQLRDGLAPVGSASPLLNLNVTGVQFTANVAASGAKPASSTVIQLSSAAIDAAQTYDELVTALNAAIAATPAAAGMVATKGAAFTSINGVVAAGNFVDIKSTTGQTFTNQGFTFATTSTGAFTLLGNFTQAEVVPTAALVTSTIILDDVGRGSTGGDLVVGGLSVGDTSTSRGVERFEITVKDSSKLQTINSTNNALREVTIVNGETSNSSSAYNTVVLNKGDLTVNGAVATDTALPGANNYTRVVNGVVVAGQAAAHTEGTAAGFTDVRLIDASTLSGKLAFTAAVTVDSIQKYITAVDTAANPAADVAGTGNVNFDIKGANFIYTGGTNNDTMVVTIDGAVASSRSTVVSGQSDFTFAINGGAGDDNITTTVINPALAGGAQAWYNNQKLNANITISAGDGNDTVKTPGAGDKIIDLGAGNDTLYTDNTGTLARTTIATGTAGTAATAYANAAAAELAAGQAAAIASNTTGFVVTDGRGIANPVTTAAVVAALNAADITPTNPPAHPVISHADLATATATAVAAGGLTLAQKIALDAAYGSVTGGTITPAGTLAGASTIVGSTASAVVNVTPAELLAGDTLLATYLAAAKAANFAAVAADTLVNATGAYDTNGAVTALDLLNTTQKAVINAQQAVTGVDDPLTGGNEAGTANIVAGLAALQPALVFGATAASVIAALDAAVLNGSISGAQATALQTATGTSTAAVTAILSPLQNQAAINNAAAQVTLTNALTADRNIVNAASTAVAADPVLGNGVLNNIGGAVTLLLPAVAQTDNIGTTEAALAAAVAKTASDRAAVDVTTLQAINTALTGLKAAVNVLSTDAQVTNALANASASINIAIANGATNGATTFVNPLTAVANNPTVALNTGATELALLAGVGGGGATVIAAEELAFDTGALGVTNVNSIDSLVTANTDTLGQFTLTAANAAAIAAATATASAVAVAANASGGQSDSFQAAKAVFVFNTANQASTYNNAQMDERNLADIKSDASNTSNFFNATVKVTYKGIDVSVVVAGTGYKTTDLEINQAIKAAINSPTSVLSKLLVATDGPANSLVVTSLIDGTHAAGNLAVTLTVPTTVTAADLAGATTAYGLTAGTTDAALLTFMGAAKTAFDTKGDYTTQFAEAGAAGGNGNLTGANSTASTDNTVTPGTGNDIVVLSTTVGTDGMTSSNEKIVFGATDLGADTIVGFAATGFGADTLDFTALGGRGNVALNNVVLDKSIVIGTPVPATGTALTNAQIVALFTDSVTAISHVYVAVDSTNIGSIYKIADGAGIVAGNVTATLVGTIDLADTSWGALTAANFA